MLEIVRTMLRDHKDVQQEYIKLVHECLDQLKIERERFDKTIAEERVWAAAERERMAAERELQTAEFFKLFQKTPDLFSWCVIM